jgi:hypothetical protein
MIQALYEPEAAYERLLGPEHEELSAGIPVVGAHRLHDRFERDAVFVQRVWTDANLILQHVSADRENVGHTRHGLELKLHDPVVQFPQVGVAILAARVHAFVERQVIDEDLPEAG